MKVGQNSLKKTFKDYMILNIYGIGSETTKGENRGETTRREMTTVLSTSLQDRFFTWRFILNGNDSILSETIYCFCSCALFPNIYCKINSMTKNGSDLGNFYSKPEFWKIFIKKNIFFWLSSLIMILNYSCSITKLNRNFEQVVLVENCIHIIYPINFCIFCSHFYYGKNENISF